MESKIDEIIELVNGHNWDKAYKETENLTVDELEQLIEKSNIESFNVKIIINLLPEERREKYIDTLSRKSNKLEIILSLSDDDVKAGYINQFDSATDKAKIIISFNKRDRLEYVEYLKTAVIEYSPDSKKILSFLRDEDIEEILEEIEKFGETEDKSRTESELFYIITDIPNDRREKFLQYISNEELLLRLLIDMPATAIQRNEKYIELIIDYINSETNKERVISAIKLLPKRRITPEYTQILENSIRDGKPDESTVLYLIDSKPKEEKIEYIRALLIEGILSDNVQKIIGFETFKSICSESRDDDYIFRELCLEHKEKIINSMEWSERKIERIKLLGSDESIKKYIDEFISNQNGEIQQFRENLHIDEEQIFLSIEKFKIMMIGFLSPDKQKDYLDEIITIIEKFKNKEKISALGFLSDEVISELIDLVDKEENKLPFVIYRMSEEQRANYIIENANKLSEEFKTKVIGSIRDLNLLKTLIISENLLLPESIHQLRIGSKLPKEFVEENLQWIINKEMSIYGDPEISDIKRREELTRIIGKENEDVWNNIHLRILDEKYVELLGIDKLKVISAFGGEQERILHLTDKKLLMWVNCINDYLKDTECYEWNIIGMDLLDKIESGQYDELIDSIEDISSLETSDIDLLTKLLQTNNTFNIKSIEDLRNINKIKEKMCDELIASDKIEDKRLAVLEKLFGQDIEQTIEFLSWFNNIEDLEESGVKTYLNALELIMSIDNPTELEEMYDECQSVGIIDKQFVTRAIKSEYAKQLNKDLFDPQTVVKVEGEDNIYEAGTDFRMIVCVQVVDTTNQMPHTLKDFSEGAKREWNMPNVTSQYMATSYIRNDNIACFGYVSILTNGAFVYGFNNMEPSSLLRMLYHDAGTHSTFLSPKDYGSGLEFLCPDNFINRTGTWNRNAPYNEINYSRQQNGTKKQPDYIVVFKSDGEAHGLDAAKKAQADWDGKLPIVIIDVNKCLAEQKKQVDEMRKEYRKNNSPVLARKIYNKIRNNLNTIQANFIKEHFFDEDELAEFEVTDEEISNYLREHPEEVHINEGTVSIEELASIYDGVSAEERQSLGSRLNQIYQRIRFIRKHGADKARTTYAAMQKLEERLKDENDPLVELRKQAYAKLQKTMEKEKNDR